MGGVFFRRRWAARREVVNDVSCDVATLFRILQRHFPQFMGTLKFQIASRREFERLLAPNPDMSTDIERAGRFLSFSTCSA
jgi:DNA adenine methylase